MNYRKTVAFFIVIFTALGICCRDYIPTTRSDVENLYFYFKENTAQKNIPPSFSPEPNSEPENSQDLRFNLKPTGETAEELNDNEVVKTINDTEKSLSIPETVNNYVPFTPQAPFGVWDKLHEEACEEASLSMARYYLEKRDIVFSKEAEKDIQFIASKTKGGGLIDLTVEEVKSAAENLYGYKNWRIINNPTIQDIKKELSQENIIIIPLAGREIDNPYFKNPGPLYHMLIISGYDSKKGVFVTQDPGTKRGKNFTYKFNVLLKANHDFPGDKNKINQGAARILVIVK